MPLENVHHITGSNLGVNGKEEDALNYWPNKRYEQRKNEMYMLKIGEKKD